MAADLFSVLDEGVEPSDIGSHYPPDTLLPLAPKDLPDEVLKAIKSKIRAAVRTVEALPDVDRSIAEQQDEIEMLEDRVKRQREMLRGLGGLAETMVSRIA